MKAFPWLLAGVGIGLATYILVNQPEPQYATGSEEVEDAAGKTATWGTKQRFTGTGENLIGKLKKGAGKISGDKELEGKGALDEVTGAVKDTAGQAAHAVSNTIHDLNK